MISMDSVDLEKLEKTIGHVFSDKDLLQQALTHPSWSNELKKRPGDYQRLEFLGDAVLGMLLAELLYVRCPDSDEGALSRWRASLADQDSLAAAARSIDLGSCMFLGKGEELTGGRDKDSILSDVLESLIAAVYLDEGLEKARCFVEKLFSKRIASIHTLPAVLDAKSELLEYAASHGCAQPEFVLLSESGSPHEREFEFSVVLDGRILGKGKGKSKKAAQQAASSEALKKLQILLT